MLLNKKYKCPVCLEKCITLRDKFQIVNKGNINCSNCNAKLDFAHKSDFKYYLPVLLFLILTLYYVLTEPNYPIVSMGFVIMMAYPIFFRELKECPPAKTKAPQHRNSCQALTLDIVKIKKTFILF